MPVRCTRRASIPPSRSSSRSTAGLGGRRKIRPRNRLRVPGQRGPGARRGHRADRVPARRAAHLLSHHGDNTGATRSRPPVSHRRQASGRTNDRPYGTAGYAVRARWTGVQQHGAGRPLTIPDLRAHDSALLLHQAFRYGRCRPLDGDHCLLDLDVAPFHLVPRDTHAAQSRPLMGRGRVPRRRRRRG